MRAAVAQGSRLAIDLSGLDYITSRGLRALVIAKRESPDGSQIVLFSPNERMREILAISRHDRLFQVFDENPF